VKQVVATGKTIEEAIEKALYDLKVSRERVSVVVLEEPSRGLFGLIGAKEAKVEVTYRPDPVEEGKSFLRNVLAKMNVDADVETNETQDGVILEIMGSNLGIVIGRRGQTLDALQYLVNVVANRHADKHVRLYLDAEQYRIRRRETLEQLADRIAKKVSRTRQNVRLEPMPAAERKIIHSYLQGRADVVTFSEGEEPHRYIIVAPKKA
jgi:spoIIIJ-associated protein